MRVGILSQYYPPEMGAPQARLSQLAARLTERGHEVVVLTALPNYPQGRIFPGYRRAVVLERHGGAPVIRTWICSRSKEKRASLGSAGRVAAVERFDRRPLSDQFIEVLGGA
jgi:hypothetical protein